MSLHYWHGPFGWREVERQAAQIMGHPVSRNTLNHHLGTRNAPKPWINDPPERGNE